MGKRIPNVGVIIAAGGSGVRYGGRRPKQFLLLGGKTILQRSIEAFHAIPFVRSIVLVVPGSSISLVRRIVRNSSFRKIAGIVDGGATRQASVKNGLMAFHPRPEIVLVHDAVRPLVGSAAIRAVAKAAIDWKAAVVGCPVADTAKAVSEHGFVNETLDRSRIWVVQTPQAFRFDVLQKAHDHAERQGIQGTDDASLVEHLGIPVRLVHGDPSNIKITTRDDLKLAGLLLRIRQGL